MPPPLEKKRADVALVTLIYGSSRAGLASNIPAAVPDTLTAPAPEKVVTALLQWFEQHGRSFSWRSFTDPFHVLVAEILLRKTTARAVEQHLPLFLTEFPDPQKLAAAGLDDVISVLEPLGLSRQRAGQMQELAVYLEEHHDGRVPDSLPDLMRLPGVGAYTACMVAASCFDMPVLPVDTNVARLICRIWGFEPSHAEARKSRNVWEAAGVLARCSSNAPERLAWALLDLAAGICTARKPRCTGCPLKVGCYTATKPVD